jgi:SAM-dependent methyltransferase
LKKALPNESLTMLRRDLHEANRQAWNHATPVHNSHKKNQADFLKRGGTTLFPEELELLGELSGLDIVHLQCNAGQDSLSLANLGAHVIAIDISDAAIEFALDLSARSGIDAEFVRADIFDWFSEAAEKPKSYDIAFCSYGAFVWLSNINLWARGVEAILKPGGRLVVVDFHPLIGIFDEDWQIMESYFSDNNPVTWDPGVGDYVGESGGFLSPSGYLVGIENFTNPNPSHEFQWSISDILTAVIDAGLIIKTFKEYPYSNGANLLPDMKRAQKNRYLPPEGLPEMPLMFGLLAERLG